MKVLGFKFMYLVASLYGNLKLSISWITLHVASIFNVTKFPYNQSNQSNHQESAFWIAYRKWYNQI